MRDRRELLLFALQDPRFGALQDDPQFSRLCLRAAAA